MQQLYHQLKQFGQVKLNELLAKHTTFKIGGAAQFFVVVEDNGQMVKLLNCLSEQDVEYYILGGGSNLLFSDEPMEKVVIKVTSSKLQVSNNFIEVDAGVPLGRIVAEASKNNLSGLEWAIGIPGTVGGAVRGNAGAMGKEIANIVSKVKVWQNGEVLELNNTECDFGYRESGFKKSNQVVLSATFNLTVGDKQNIASEMQKYLQQRTGRYPAFPSAGSFFKNLNVKDWPGKIEDLPELFRERGKIPVGWLVEQVEMKGFTVGGAKVSDEHGNFIINFKEAKQTEILQVVEAVKEKVYNRFGVELEEEVEIVK
jgi:UDP-N-acetylmuramate dehydrogenase